jgi:flagellar hook-basal body complex protein FliE
MASGCTSTTNTKHFANNIISFDYPNDMTISQEKDSIDLYNNNYDGASIQTTSLKSNETFESYLNNSKETWIQDNSPDTYNQSEKFIIQGKPAYNVTTINQDGSQGFSTYIDIGNKVLIVQPNIASGVKDQKTTKDYRVYEVILNSLKFK